MIVWIAECSRFVDCQACLCNYCPNIDVNNIRATFEVIWYFISLYDVSMFQRNESDTKEPGIVKHSINTLMFRSLKRTHDLFVASQSLSIPTHEQSSRLRKACKINSEYSAVKHMSAPNETAARVSSKTESGPVLGPYNQSDIEANIPSDDPGNRDAYRGSTALVSARDNNPLKSALALKAITTEKVMLCVLCNLVTGH